MRVFVTETHTRMALALVRELCREGHETVSVARGKQRSLCHASVCAALRVTLPEEGYADALLALGDGKSVLMPTGMHTLNLAAARKAEFTRAFRMLLTDKDKLDAAGDKPAVAAAARALGLRVPEEYPPDAPRFPCVVKFRNGEALRLKAGERYAIVQSRAEYEQALARMAPLGEVFVSQYVPGAAFGVSTVLGEASEPLAVFMHTREREYPASGGPACLARSVWHDGLARAGVLLMKTLGLRGFAMAEFKGSFDAPYLLEVNPRVWGTYPLSALCDAGMAEAYVRGAVEGAGEHRVRSVSGATPIGTDTAVQPAAFSHARSVSGTDSNLRNNAAQLTGTAQPVAYAFTRQAVSVSDAVPTDTDDAVRQAGAIRPGARIFTPRACSIWDAAPTDAGNAVRRTKTVQLSALMHRYRLGVRMQYLANDLAHLRATGDLRVLLDFLDPRVKGGVFDWRDLPGTLAYARAALTRR